MPAALSEKITKVLDEADDFLSVDDICRAVFRRVGDRERSNVYLVLHRMGDQIEKRPAGYRKKPAPAPKR